MPTANRRRDDTYQPTPEINHKAQAYLDRSMERAIPGHSRIVVHYRSRGLTVAPSPYIGYVENEWYFDAATGKQSLPAMLAFLQNADGEPVGVHRTYLDPKGSGKADVTDPKKLAPAIFRGATNGAAIWLRDCDGRRVGFAEGIVTAESVFQATGIPTQSTVSAGGMGRLDVPEGFEHVVIWADNDASGVGQRAAAKLAKRLYRQGITVTVIIPPEPDTDWNDVLVTQGEEAIRRALSEATCCDPNDSNTPSPDELYPDENPETKKPKSNGTNAGGTLSPAEEAVVELNLKHFVVQVGGKVHIATEKLDPITGHLNFQLGSKADFSLLYMYWNVPIDGENVQATSIWLSSPDRREYEGIDFFPGKDVPQYYNLWQGFAVEPRQGNCSLFWQHLFFVICRGDRHHYRYLRKWMAHLVQHADELPGVAIVIRGKQGTGKSVFVDQLGGLFGQHFLMLTRMEQLTGRFNGHLKDSLLICANEAVWGGDKQGEGTLKALITDPVTPIELKGKDIINVRNYKRLIVTTNERWAVPMGMDDRRFLVLEASDEYKEDKRYFRALTQQMTDGGREALLYDLMHENLDGFDVRTAPRSDHSFDIKLRGADPIVRWWFERLHEGATITNLEPRQNDDQWNVTPSKTMLYKDFLTFCDTHKGWKLDKPIFGKEFRKMLPGATVSETRRYMPQNELEEALDGPQNRGRAHCYKLPTLAECRSAFEAFAKAGPEIWPDGNDHEI